jgi:iron uptake system component EfeO
MTLGFRHPILTGVVIIRDASNARRCSEVLQRLALLCAIAIGGIQNAHSAPLDDAAEHYRPHLIASIDQALTGASRLRERLAAGDVLGATRAWIDARTGWEQSEVFTSAFVPDLDRSIDAWPDAASGFHAIEAKLFGAKRTDLEPEATALVQNLKDLSEVVRRIDLSPDRLLDGVARLAYEVGESKVDGGESRVSGTSLDDMRNNIEGIDLAYRTIFATTLEATDPGLATKANDEIETLKTLVGTTDLKAIDSDKLRVTSEKLVLTLQHAAPKIGLQTPTLEDVGRDATVRTGHITTDVGDK